ncbi:MAG: hypothetical protein E7256_07700 [Lachnospiraceae bacterium]|nr:hypothetical protein [Lachnospiraceae bacterium]
MKYFGKLKKCVSMLVVFTVMFAFVACGKKTEDVVKRYDTTIHIVSFSDFHGAVDNATSSKNPGMDKFASVIKDYTSNASDENGYIVVSGGDNYQGTAMANLTFGKVINEMFEEIGVTYSAIGNHEYDWGSDYFKTWENQGNFNFLAANIVDKETGKLVEYAQPYGIVEINGRKIGFIGIATPETASKTLVANVEHLEFLDPVSIVNKYAKQLRIQENVDAVIVLSHLGSAQDESGVITGEAADLANAAVGVDAILTGHTHNYAEGTVNGIPILGTPNNGRAVGHLTLTFTGDELEVTYELNDLVDKVDELESDEATKAIYDKYQEELSPMLDEVITELPMDLEHDRNSGDVVTDLGQYTSKLLTEITGCQIVLNNGGGIRSSLEAGDLTVGDMYTVFPFDNTIVTMEITGADLKANLEHGLNPDNGVGYVQYYGVNVVMDMSREAGDRIVSLTLTDGTKVEMDQYYTLATNEFMASNGDGFDFSNAINMSDEGIVMRDVMIDALKKIDRIEFIKEASYVEQ